MSTSTKPLEQIGFYTLSDERVKQVSSTSPMWRTEMLLTDQCNFNCPYCRGPRDDCKGTLSLDKAKTILSEWSKNVLKNVRFSGGEPTMYKGLFELVAYAKSLGVERIALSTNGSANVDVYDTLVNLGVSDFSVSLDACCASFGDKMAGGIPGMWKKVVQNIKFLAKKTYVTVGCVFTQETINTVKEVIEFADSLGVADVRIISAAQYNETLEDALNISAEVLGRHPILRYRIDHMKSGTNVRGIGESDSKQCHLVVDDSAVAGNYHFPCIIYLREGGSPIGEIGTNSEMRAARAKWCEDHDTHADPICSKNCLDVCVDYNNRFRKLREGK